MSRNLTKEDFPAALEEFSALRSEILARIQIRSRLMALAVALFGAIGTLAANQVLPPETLFIFPLISCFIALEWSYHDNRIFAAALYIKKEIEPSIPGLGWQHYLDETRQYRRLRVAAWSAGGIFICASILTLLVTLNWWSEFMNKYSYLIIGMYLVNVAAICVSIWAIAIRQVDKISYKS